MGYWDELDQAVQTTVRLDRIGTPVFVRCTAATAESVGTIQGHLALLVSSVNKWFGAAPARLYALRTSDGAHLSVTLEYPPGFSAVLSVSPGHARPEIDLVVLGSRGAIYHHDTVQPVAEATLAVLESDGVQPIMAAIERSCTLGNPVELSPEVGK